MVELGEKLKKAREKSGLDLIAISQRIKINIKYLEAIENSTFDALPEAYVKMFISSYARELGLNLEENITEKRIDSSKSENSKLENVNTEQSTMTNEILRFLEVHKNKILIIIISIIFIILFLIIKSFWNDFKGDSSKVNVINVENYEESVKDKPAIIVKETSENKKTDSVSSEMFSIISTEECYLFYYTDKEDIKERKLDKNDTLSFYDCEFVEFKSGRSNVLKIELFGKDVTGELSNIKGTSFGRLDAEGLKILKQSDKITNYLKVRYGK
ncbi:MAG: helix-turn-helix domain-containing protein [Candidatus Delongbacteria bacterium]|nr:helix-turn-helix domain-containing protein [Candidatus Delongbacteria bacterium]MBN2835821.1 helix-turn-helix domain-containing protein [Candidatus Delongbacteria bacterium]